LKNQHVWLKILSILFILFFLHIPPPSSAETPTTWNTDWKYQHQLPLTIDTTDTIAHNQPVDIKISFNHPCYAESEKKHSVRVCCLSKGVWTELESQIYDLTCTDQRYISSCSLVFLIPEFADGTEQYYVYYNDQETEEPAYTDHVSITESQYYYEPISGYPLDSEYYKIVDTDDIPYVISQQGHFMGYNTGQHIIKMKENITEMLPQNQEIFAGFDYKYSYGKGVFDYCSTSQKLQSKEILVDGNLMVRCQIISTSKLDDLKTTATYSYYHCPTITKRIHVQVCHETLSTIQVTSDANTDGIFASLHCSGVKSNSIRELNIGDILPNLFISTDENSVQSHPIDINPEYIPKNPYIRIITTQDDIDLGSLPWFSFFNDLNGFCHAMVFGSTDIEMSNTGERSGLQVNAFQMDYPHLPGLENNVARVHIGKNTFEPSETQNLVIPSGYTVSFQAEFFTGYLTNPLQINNETKIFQNLIQMKPQTRQKQPNNSSVHESYDLTIYTHLCPSFPFGAALSAALGINFSYITAELYQNNELQQSATVGRLPFRMITEDTDTLLEKIRASLVFFDWKNLTFFKHIVFKDLHAGTYVIRIYKEHPFLKDRRIFIGTTVINLTKNTTEHIWCTSEHTLSIHLYDQLNKDIPDATVQFLHNEEIIFQNRTNRDGICILAAPKIRESYVLEVIYQHCLVYTEEISFKKLDNYLKQKKEIQINRYPMTIILKDLWDLPPGIPVQPALYPIEDHKKNSISHTNQKNNSYFFSNIPQGSYQFEAAYKSVRINHSIDHFDETVHELLFPATNTLSITVYDNRGSPITHGNLSLTRSGKKQSITFSSSLDEVTIPPGTYLIELFDGSKNILTKPITITSDRSTALITSSQPLYPLLTCIFVAVFIGFISMYYLRKQQLHQMSLLFSISFIIISLVLPWWNILGQQETVKVTTNMYLIPVNLITITQSNAFHYGEIAYLPDVFILVIQLISFISIGALLLLSVTLLTEKKNKKKRTTYLILSGLILLGISLALFITSITLLSEVSIGGFIGSEKILTSLAHETTPRLMQTTWGPALGFYLYCFACVPLVYLLIKPIIKSKEQ